MKKWDVGYVRLWEIACYGFLLIKTSSRIDDKGRWVCMRPLTSPQCCQGHHRSQTVAGIGKLVARHCRSRLSPGKPNWEKSPMGQYKCTKTTPPQKKPPPQRQNYSVKQATRCLNKRDSHFASIMIQLQLTKRSSVCEALVYWRQTKHCMSPLSCNLCHIASEFNQRLA